MFIKNEQASKVNKLHLLQFCSANIPNIIMSWADYDWDFHAMLFVEEYRIKYYEGENPNHNQPMTLLY